MVIYIYLKHFPALGTPLIGGTAKAVHGIAQGLAACGGQVTVLCEGTNAHVLEANTGYQIRCFAASPQNRPFSITPDLKRYVRDELTRHDSLVILNGMFNPSVYALSRELRRYHIPYIMAPHDPYHPAVFAKRGYLKWPYWFLFERNLLRKARAIQVLDQRHGEYLRHLKISTPVIEVVNGVPEDGALPELLWNVDAPVRLLYLGRIDSQNKGLDLLLDAFAGLIEQGANAHLTIQGSSGGDRKALEDKAAALFLADRVHFLESDFTRPSIEIIAEHDIFCLPSRFEGFSLATGEAMLAGRMVLVSEVAGIAPHVRASQCGVVVEPSVPAILEGMNHLLADQAQWKIMGMRGRQYVLEHLQWNVIASRALAEYERLRL